MNLLRSESGVTLVLVLVLMTILGLTAGLAGSTWSSLTRRAREADLLWKGGQIRAAIGSYYQASHGGGAAKIYPSKLEYLLKDPRFLQTRRHLRRPYVDPMTGSDWELIKDKGGRIKGVRSSFAEEPFKQGGFSLENKEFAGRELYSEWEFIYLPGKVDPVAGKGDPSQN
jgi:type II secretory pathway pseudopilin PulG